MVQRVDSCGVHDSSNWLETRVVPMQVFYGRLVLYYWSECVVVVWFHQMGNQFNHAAHDNNSNSSSSRSSMILLLQR